MLEAAPLLSETIRNTEIMLYYKIIDERTVISQCRTLHTAEGWISNPTEEQIFADGWQVYVPPPFVPQPQDEPDYYEVMEAVKKILSSETEEMSDEDALAIAALYPTWHSKIGQQVAVGTRLWDDGKLWKVIQPHTVQEDWRPADAVSLFVEVSIEEWPPIPEVIPSTAPWMAGQKGTWKGLHYICNMDNCVWNPDQYPQAWNLA